MNTRKSDLAFIMEKDEVQMCVSKNWTGDYYAIETAPFAEETVFVLERAIDKVENTIFGHFKDLLREIFGNYALKGYAPGMDIDLENKTIKMISDSKIRDELTIQYLYDKIVFTFRKDMRKYCSNNRVILDKDGVLGFGYFIFFKDFFDKLMIEETRDPSDKSRIRKFGFSQSND